MKIKLLFFILLVMAAWSVFAQADISKEITATANAGFENYLQKIPLGEESFFGFKTREEFANVKIDKPYQIYTLNADFFNDTSLSEKNYLLATNEWRVALSVDNEFRVILTIAKVQDTWQVVSIGAAALAKELDGFEKKHISVNTSGMILRIYQMDCDFILSSPDNSLNNIKVYLPESAKIALNKTNEADLSYTLQQVLVLAKTKIENK